MTLAHLQFEFQVENMCSDCVYFVMIVYYATKIIGTQDSHIPYIRWMQDQNQVNFSNLAKFNQVQ